MVTLLNVVVIGGFLLGMMAVVYRASIRSVEGQKKVQLLIDYEARQQSLLRSLVTLTPQFAANTMMDNSSGDASATFAGMFTTAGNMAKLGEVLTAQERIDMGFGGMRSGNKGDAGAAYNITDFIGGGLATVASGVRGGVQPAGYPPVMGFAGANNTGVAPELSSNATYVGTGIASRGGLVDFAMLTYPDIHFGYKNPGANFITRQNWWQLYVHPRRADLATVGLGTAGMAMNQSRYEYILSVYEIPSQLAISAAAFIDIGTNVTVADTVGAGNDVVVQGNVFAKGANVAQGAIASIATTQGATLAAGTTVGGQALAATQGANAKEVYEAANQAFYPISKASDYARSLFVPINPGFAFFDRFANVAAGTNMYSADTWYDYSRGCNQCVMRLDVVETDLAGNPITLQYSTAGGAFGTFICKGTSTFRGGAFVEWPDVGDLDFNTFPFESTLNNAGTAALAIHLDRIEAWLQTVDGGAVALANIPDYDSIVINADDTIVGGNAVAPTQNVSPVTVQLYGGDDLSGFTNGFSIVSSYELEILDNFNNTPVTPGGTDYPPTSIFAPVVRYGVGGAVGTVGTVNVVGGISSLNTTSTANTRVDIFQFEDLEGGAVGNVTAELDTINTLDQLPPVNMMNWLVVIQKQGM
ncbi:hypothetical protein [Rubritalea marina]|uniref:hypothetical protein n=1 Tax=Rubritalea marina TaxID=361055 RepID=UPI0012EA35E1|nr:hypothetical protein [Rubritalea marina]